MSILLLSICTIMPTTLSMSKYEMRNACRYEKKILKEAHQHGIDPYLLASLIYVESNFRPHVVSRAGACGLTQVIPKWTGSLETRGKKYTCEQLKNPDTAISVGARILSYVTTVYAKGNIDKGLCYYNAGTKCITRQGFYKRLYYVKKVRQIHNKIKRSL